MKKLNTFILSWVTILTPMTAQEIVTPGSYPTASEIVIAVNHRPEKHGYTFPGQDPTTGLSSGDNSLPQEAEADSATSWHEYSDSPFVADALFLFPNPTSGMVQVKLSGKVTIQIYTLSGQLVKKYTLKQGEKFLDLGELPSGIYQVRAKSDEDYYSGKLLIQ